VTIDEKKRRITEEKLDFCLLKAENRKQRSFRKERTTMDHAVGCV
jgi:hypothetical protein